MFPSWKFIFLVIMSTVILTACGQSLEEQVADGVKVSEEAFLAKDKADTEEIDGVKLYKPVGFTVKENSDAQNIIFEKNDETFILFINPNEEADSHLFYDILLADQNKKMVAMETFVMDERFGFVAVVESDDNKVELIASVGGAKMTTLAKEKNIASNLRTMMEVVRSIND